MNDTLMAILIVGIVGTLLTFARRYKNPDESAGMGIAGWTLFIIILLLLSMPANSQDLHTNNFNEITSFVFNELQLNENDNLSAEARRSFEIRNARAATGLFATEQMINLAFYRGQKSGEIMPVRVLMDWRESDASPGIFKVVGYNGTVVIILITRTNIVVFTNNN